MSMQSRRFVVGALALTLPAFLLTACGGDGTAATVQQAQQPAPAAQPQPAAPAPEPQAAPRAPGVQAPAPAAPAVPKAAVEEPKYGGIPTIGVREDAGGGWDIMKVTGWVDMHQMGAPMWGSGNLTKPCRENVFQICPSLAESWEPNSDFTQWTFKIRDDVLWHDGVRFTAEDAKFWLELAQFGAKTGDKVRRPAWFQGELGNPKKAEVLEGNRLRITLTGPQRLFPEIIGRPHLHLAHPRHLMQPRIEKGEMDVSPQDIGWVGTGPFKIQKHAKGTRVQVTRFDRYWERDAKGRQLPYLDGIDFAIIRDPAAMDAAFRVGRLDGGAPAGGYTLTPERKAGYVRDMGDKVWFAEAPSASGGQFIGFNILKSGPQQDIRVRRAAALWIDKPEYIVSETGGFGELTTILNAKNPFTSPDFMTWPGWNPGNKERDRAEAKRLLAEAGYARGAKITYPCWTTQLSRCVYLKAQLAGLGIDLELTLGDQVFITRARTGLEFDTSHPTAPRTPFPEGLVGLLGPYSLTPGGIAKHEDSKIMGFFNRLSEASNFEQRVNVFRELERYFLLEQVYMVPLGSTLQVVPYRSYVKGLPVPAEDHANNLDHAKLWLDK